MPISKDCFARHFGFDNYNELIKNSELIIKHNGVNYFVTKLPDNTWIAWDDEDLTVDTVYEAESYDNALTWIFDGIDMLYSRQGY